ncbi:MAG: C1 family peptidase [Pirellulales bacterium]
MRFFVVPLLAAAWALLGSPLPAAPPSSYDLRTAGPGGASWITPVKTQGKLSTCWSFSTAAAFQSSLMRQGIVTDPNSPLLDLSEWDDATHNGYDHPDYTFPYNAKGTGGSQHYTVAYYVRGQGVWNTNGGNGPQVAGGGPVLESQDPLNVYPLAEMGKKLDLTPYIPPADQAPAYQLDSAQFLWQDGLVPGTPTTPLDQQLDRMKNAVIEHGALSVAMFYQPSSYDEATQTYYFSGPSDTPTDHLVTVAGWDDSQAVPGAPAPGAWLIQNSWGTDFGDQGYFWISYQDALINKFPATLIGGELPGGTQVWQNQVLYPTSHYGGKTGSDAQAAAVIDVAAGTVVEALGLFSNYAQQSAEIRVYDHWDASGPSGLLADFSHTFALPGYDLVSLPSALPWANAGSLVVTVDYGTGFEKPIPYEPATAPLAGLSYVRDDKGNWQDMATIAAPGVFAVKVVTAPEPTGGLLALLAGLGIVRIRRWAPSRAGCC